MGKSPITLTASFDTTPFDTTPTVQMDVSCYFPGAEEKRDPGSHSTWGSEGERQGHGRDGWAHARLRQPGVLALRPQKVSV